MLSRRSECYTSLNMKDYINEVITLVVMSEILHKRKNKVIEIGNSLGFRTKSFYLELAGMKQKDTEVTEAVIHGKHGILIGYWLPGNQPQQITDAELEKLKQLNGGD